MANTLLSIITFHILVAYILLLDRWYTEDLQCKVFLPIISAHCFCRYFDFPVVLHSPPALSRSLLTQSSTVFSVFLAYFPFHFLGLWSRRQFNISHFFHMTSPFQPTPHHFFLITLSSSNLLLSTPFHDSSFPVYFLANLHLSPVVFLLVPSSLNLTHMPA